MTVTRISTYNVFRNTLTDVSNVQNDLFNLQRQISSGLKTDEFKGITGQVEQFTNLEAKIARARVYEESNTTAITRLETANTSLDQLIELTDQIENLMVLRRNGALGQSINFEQQIKDLRQQLGSELNASFEGRFLFGGTRTDIPPVKDDPFPVPSVTPPALDLAYYQGGTEDVSHRAQDNFTIQFDVRADNQAFQKLFTSIELALQGDTASDDAVLRQAVDMIQESSAEIISLQSRVNSDIVSLKDINERHEGLRLYWQGVTEEIIKTDILSASTEVAVNQAVLQASFQAFARINELRLSDFLN